MTINFVIGTVEPTGSIDGYLDVFAVINKLLEYLTEKSSFNKKYTLNYPVKWTVSTNETADPYFYGQIETSFVIPAISQYTKQEH